MMHEILLALNGYPGSFFIEDNDGNYTVIKDIPFLHQSELAILDSRLCKLISDHKFIQNFVDRYNHVVPLNVDVASKSLDTDFHPSGMYLRAVCKGLTEMLQTYHRLLLDFEKQILEDPYLPLTYLLSSLEDYFLCFQTVVSLLTDIQTRRIYGCRLLDVIHAQMSPSNPFLYSVIKKIAFLCHGVMYKQISAWLLHGLLIDPYGEFFIQKAPMAVSAPVDEDFSEGSDRSSSTSTTSSSCDDASGSEYVIQADMLPTYIPVSVVEKICFVGESFHLLMRKDDKHCKQEFLILQNRDEFAKQLIALQNEEDFNFISFKSIIDSCRQAVAEQLWRLIVEEVNLANHLRIMKDFFLLGRGELFQAFIDQAGKTLQQPISASTERSINVAFHVAARSVLYEDDALERFSVNFRSDTQKPVAQSVVEFYSKSKAEIGWNNLNLSYKVGWPLHIILTKNVLEKYNVIFRFLIFVKHAQSELHRCWTLQMQRKNRQSEDHYPAAWKLRTLMAFIVDNLQYYLQVDVLESQYSLLLEKVMATRDYEEIRLAHENFLVSLLAQSFLSTKAIATCITDLLELCLNFCQQYNIASSLPARVTDQKNLFSQATTFSSKVGEMNKQFGRQAGVLFQILSSSQTYRLTPFVEQLVMRLDFNNYFSMRHLQS